MVKIPAQFRENTVATWGDKDVRWIQDLPEIIHICERRWHFVAQETPFNLSYGYVTTVLREDRSTAALKLYCNDRSSVDPKDDELASEINALTAFAGRKSVTLLESDYALGALLLERPVPGTMLSTLPEQKDQEVTHAAGTHCRCCLCAS